MSLLVNELVVQCVQKVFLTKTTHFNTRILACSPCLFLVNVINMCALHGATGAWWMYRVSHIPYPLLLYLYAHRASIFGRPYIIVGCNEVIRNKYKWVFKNPIVISQSIKKIHQLLPYFDWESGVGFHNSTQFNVLHLKKKGIGIGSKPQVWIMSISPTDKW